MASAWRKSGGVLTVLAALVGGGCQGLQSDAHLSAASQRAPTQILPSESPLPTSTPTPQSTPTPPPPPPACTQTREVPVGNAVELMAAIAAAQACDVILLAPADYGDFRIDQKSFSNFVTLRSSDVQNRAVFGLLVVARSQFLRFESIVVHHPMRVGDAEWTRAVDVTQSNHIEVWNSELYGSADGNYDNDVYGFFAQADDVVFSGNAVHDFTRGSVIGGSHRVTVSGNTFYHIRSDGADFGGVTDVLVENNLFYDFYPCCGDHPDHIQFWNDNGTEIQQNVVIRGNTSLRGNGDPTQSIFIQANSPFRNRNYLIENNVVYNGTSHGITASEIDGVTIRHNTVLADDAPSLIPSINTYSTTGAIVEDNVASAYSNDSPDTISRRNVQAQNSDARQVTFYDALFVNAQAGRNAVREDFRPRYGSILVRDPGADIGALELNFSPTQITAYLLADRTDGPAPLSVQFDGALSASPASTIQAWNWDFGDGTSQASGPLTSHRYTVPGTYFATLTVTDDQQRQASATQMIIVTLVRSDDLLLYLNFNEQFMDVSGRAHAIQCSNACTGFSYLSGHPDSALSLAGNATEDYPIAAYAPDLDGMARFTMAVWAKKSSASTGGMILLKHVSYTLALNAGTFGGYIFNAAGTRLDYAASAPADTAWHHYAVTYDGAAVLMYVDGVAMNHAAFTRSIAVHADRNLDIGKDPWGNSFAGLLDEIRLYNRALSAAEIAALAQ